MSGHNKWSTIKHKKAKEDAKRSKIFTKLIKEITVAARLGGGDIETNPRLRTVVMAAKAANMPQENIIRAIKKGTGELEGVNYEEATYEGYGPGGAAVIVDVLTDNKKRTVAAIRHIFSKYGGNLAETGAVSWMFETKGYITIEKELADEDTIMEAAIESGADDVQDEGDVWGIYTASKELDAVRKALEEAGFKLKEAKLTKVAKNTITLEGKNAEKMLKLMDALDDNDDVKEIYSNFDISDELMNSLT